MIYAEVLQVADVQKCRIPPKPSINNILRHSRSEENIIEGTASPNSNPSSHNGDSSNLSSDQSPPSSSTSNIPTSNSSCIDLNLNADCWSQEDDEISQQVRHQLPHLFSQFKLNFLLNFPLFSVPVPPAEVEKMRPGHNLPNEPRLLRLSRACVRGGAGHPEKIVRVHSHAKKYLPERS